MAVESIITIEDLIPTGAPSREHVIPAMKGGVSSKLTIGQILGLLVDAAPEALDTLNELADALGNDPNFAATVATQLGLKANSASLGTMAGQNANSVAITGGAIANTALSNGAVVDRAFASYSVSTGLAAAIPLDDTIPQNTEGTEIMSVSITPKSVTNRLRARASLVGSVSANSQSWIAALFSSASVNALASRFSGVISANFETSMFVEWEWVPGTTSPVTVSVRAGPATGTTLFLNGNSSGRVFGGSSQCTLVVEEIKG